MSHSIVGNIAVIYYCSTDSVAKYNLFWYLAIGFTLPTPYTYVVMGIYIFIHAGK